MDDTLPTLLIPAYQPDEKLLSLLHALRQTSSQQRIIVVDDGSDHDYAPIFAKAQNYQIELLRHTSNQGKGEALKTGFRHWLRIATPDEPGIITADADGQHAPEDIQHLSAKFSNNPQSLYLGVRQFDQQPVPWRSRFGNQITRWTLRLLTKTTWQDTQTGLRAIPRHLIPDLLSSKTSAYDFEMEMLLIAKKKSTSIQQIPIQTIYLENNRTSHFNPLIDSIKIYFVFIRFAAISFFSALVDFTLFSLMYTLKKNIFLAVLLGRVLSATLNFKLNQQLAFRSQNALFPAMLKYTGLASVLGLIAYSFIRIIHGMGMNIYNSKIIAEIALFLLSFTIQRLFIFNKM